MKITLPILVAAASLALAPGYAFAQHVDVGPGGVGVHADDHHEHGHEHADEHRTEKHVDHHDDGHGESHEHVTVEKHSH